MLFINRSDGFEPVPVGSLFKDSQSQLGGIQVGFRRYLHYLRHLTPASVQNS